MGFNLRLAITVIDGYLLLVFYGRLKMARARRCSTTLVVAVLIALCACFLACGAHALATDAEGSTASEVTVANQLANASETGTQSTPPPSP